MSDPFEMLRKQAETEQALAAVENVAKMARMYHQALTSAGFPGHIADAMTLDWHRLTLMQAYGLKP